jgi:hypothetical protein
MLETVTLEAVTHFMLGFLTASLIAVMLISAFWRRIVKAITEQPYFGRSPEE